MKTEKEYLQDKILKINEDLAYLFSKINWDTSFLDARAITIMNEIRSRINNLMEEK